MSVINKNAKFLASFETGQSGILSKGVKQQFVFCIAAEEKVEQDMGYAAEVACHETDKQARDVNAFYKT